MARSPHRGPIAGQECMATVGRMLVHVTAAKPRRASRSGKAQVEREALRRARRRPLASSNAASWVNFAAGRGFSVRTQAQPRSTATHGLTGNVKASAWLARGAVGGAPQVLFQKRVIRWAPIHALNGVDSKPLCGLDAWPRSWNWTTMRRTVTCAECRRLMSLSGAGGNESEDPEGVRAGREHGA